MNKNWLLALFVVAWLLFLIRVWSVLLPFFLALGISYLLYPFVQAFERRRVPRSTAILLVYAICTVLVAVAIAVLLPQLSNELAQMLRRLPSQTRRWDAISDDALRSLDFLRQLTLPVTLQELANAAFVRLEQLAEAFAARLTELLVSLISRLFSVLIAPVLAFYMMKDHHFLRMSFFANIPVPYRKDVSFLVSEINLVLNRFVRGQLLISMAVGALLSIGLFSLDIPYAFVIGVFAGIANIIPYLGPVIGIVPAVAFAASISPVQVLWVLLLFGLVNQLEASLIGPRVMSGQLGLHPLAVIFALLVGAELLGLIGLLIAVPIAAVFKVFFTFAVTKAFG